MRLSGALSFVLSMAMLVTPSYASKLRGHDTNMELSQKKGMLNQSAIYAGYCLGCTTMSLAPPVEPTVSKSVSTKPVVSSSSITRTPSKVSAIPLTLNSELLFLPAPASIANDTFFFTDTSHTSSATKPSKKVNEQYTIQKKNTSHAKMVEPSLSSSRDDDSIYTQQIFLSIILLGVAASAASSNNNKQHQLSEEPSGKNGILKRRSLTKDFNRLEVDIQLAPTLDDDSVLTITPKSIADASDEENDTPPVGAMEQLLKHLSPVSWKSNERRVIFGNVSYANNNDDTKRVVEEVNDDNVSQTSSMLGVSMLLKRIAFNKAFNKWETSQKRVIFRDDVSYDEVVLQGAVDKVTSLINEKEGTGEQNETYPQVNKVESIDESTEDSSREEEDEPYYYIATGKIVSAREARAVLAAEGHPDYQSKVVEAPVKKENSSVAIPQKSEVRPIASTTLNIQTQRRIIFPELDKYEYNF